MGEIADRLNRMLRQGIEEQTTVPQSLARNFGDKIISNTMGIPNAFASVMADPGIQKFGDVLGQTAGALRTGDFSQFQRPQAPFQPLSNVDVFPELSSSDVFGMAQNMGEGAAALTSGNTQEFTPSSVAGQQQADLTALTQEQHPLASAIGQGAGTGAMLLAGRAPGATAARNARFAPSPNIPDARALVPYQSPGFKRLVSDIFRSKPVQGLSGWAKKAGETGLEGAMVGLLENGDPVEMAAFGAGSQAAGSVVLSLMPTSKGGAVRFAATIGGLWAMGRMAQEFGPGENNVFEALDFSFDKAKAGLILGTLAGVVGMGRVSNPSLRNNLPVFAEAITQIPRGAALSYINDFTKDPAVPVVTQKLASDPDYFGATARRRIERAVNSEDVSISEVIEGLMEDDSEFARRFNELE